MLNGVLIPCGVIDFTMKSMKDMGNLAMFASCERAARAGSTPE